MTIVDAAGLTDRGRVRSVNEDSLLLLDDRNLYAVADGMGGHGAGDVASQLTLSILEREFRERAGPQDEPVHLQQETNYQALEDSINAINKGVYEANRNQGHDDGSGMGTTLTGFCQLAYGDVITFNIGDSRLYRFRDGALKQITRDHSLYQEWLESGSDTPAPPKNILQKALGLFPAVEADYTVQNVSDNDLLMLCSDGLTGMLDDAQLEAMLNKLIHSGANRICEELVAAANDRGGRDNITVAIVRFGTPKDKKSKPPLPDGFQPDLDHTSPRSADDEKTISRLIGKLDSDSPDS